MSFLGGLGAVAGSVLPGVGSYLGAREQANAQRDVNAENVRLAREQMAFQERMAHSAEGFSERMSSTAHQREVADLKAAGLNPILSADSGASSPSGVTASGSLPSLGAVPSVISGVMSSAREMVDLYQRIKESNSRIMLNKEQASTTWQSGAESFERTKLVDQNRRMVEKQNELLENELNIRRKAPNLTGTLDLIKSYIPFMDTGTRAIGAMR